MILSGSKYPKRLRIAEGVSNASSRLSIMRPVHLARFSLVLIALILCFELPVLLPSAFADESQVKIGGIPVFSVGDSSLSSSSSSSSDDLILKIQHNLDNSLVAAADRSSSAVKITYVQGLPVISLGGYYITTVDGIMAKAAGSSPSLLAAKWANALRGALENQLSINAYVSQLTGKTAPLDTQAASADLSPSSAALNAATLSSASSEAPPFAAPLDNSAMSTAPPLAPAFNYTAMSAVPPTDALASVEMPTTIFDNTNGTVEDEMPTTAPDFKSTASPNSFQSAEGWQPMPSRTATSASTRGASQGRASYVPAGINIPVRLATSISSSVARPGDVIIAYTTSPIDLGSGVIPVDSQFIGTVTESRSGSRKAHSGSLSIRFTSLRTPNGVETPINAHINGSLGKYVVQLDAAANLAMN